MKAFGSWLAANWEKWLFRAIAIALFSASIWLLYLQRVTEFATLFAVAFFCWFYANIARFKRFKGFGFEAEMWEDKQREAERLIDRLKVLVGLYSREMLIRKVMEGRFGDGKNRWPEMAELYAEVVKQHASLSEDISLAETKAQLDAFFVFDAVVPLYSELVRQVDRSKREAQNALTRGLLSNDGAGVPPDHEANRYAVAKIPSRLDVEPITLAMNRTLSATVLAWFDGAKATLLETAGVELTMPADIHAVLVRTREIEEAGTLEFTPENISLQEIGDRYGP